MCGRNTGWFPRGCCWSRASARTAIAPTESQASWGQLFSGLIDRGLEDYMLDTAILKARMDDAVHVLILRGAGEKFFSAGANIKMLSSVTPEFKYYFCLHANETLSRLEQTPKLVIAALNDSYSIFKPGETPAFGDVANLLSTTVAGAFRVGVQLSAPFLVFGLLFNLGLGVLSRLMPQMQVFFVGMPLSILAGLLILVLVLKPSGLLGRHGGERA